MLSDMPTRWFNGRLPQTLVISQFLLYLNAFWSLMYTLSGSVLFLLATGAYIYGAWGIANERRQGYRVAVAAAFFPLTLRAFLSLFASGGFLGNLGWVLIGPTVISALFEYALIGLLLHLQSREHQKVWFS